MRRHFEGLHRPKGIGAIRLLRFRRRRQRTARVFPPLVARHGDGGP